MAKELKEVLEENRKNKDKHKWLKWLVIGGGLLIVGGGAFAIFYQNPANAYEFTNVARQNIQEVVDITGNVEAGVTVKLGFQQSGQLQKMYFNTGDQVKEGDVIAVGETQLVFHKI